MLNNIASLYAGGAVAGNYYSIASATVTSGGTTSITFSSIPSTYTHLQLRFITKTTRAATTENLFAYINSDLGNNYTYHLLQGNGATASVATTAPYGYWILGESTGNTNANIFAAGVTDILDYANTNKNKTIRTLVGNDQNGSGTMQFYSDLWMNTSAINSFTIVTQLSNSIAQYSQFALYGVK